MPSSGGVRLDGRPIMSEGEASMLESDVSSIISISDHLVPSDTEEEGDGLQDHQKFRMPDIGKTRLHLRTKEPLSPTPRQVPRSTRWQASTSTPSTPRRTQSTNNTQSPLRSNFPNATASTENVSDSDFVGSDLSRANSIYTLGRASLQGQLAHLTSLRLPEAISLAKRISDIPNSNDAAKALSDASDQIRVWISKASEVLNGFNAEDDVEWAAAGGREGIEDVDSAINKFQRLVDLYLLSIEELQTRNDVASVPIHALNTSVRQMEHIIASWQEVKETLKGVKEQVEIAMEWEELWNNVLGEIGQEMEGLNRLVFEMEEKRHQGAGSLFSSKESIDINELETIVEKRPGHGRPLSINRMSLPPFSPTSPLQTPPVNDSNGDSSLLALFARMQPLRASLDFLPMRLSVFQGRGNRTFPSACIDLEQRKDQLEEQWKKLEADAESLRRELGEDRWVLVFRNAGRQALKMEESITRSFNKLKEAVESSEHQTHSGSFAKKVESYAAKGTHYGPAIERVLAIIDRGVQDRLTVNGEILRLQSDLKQRWSALQSDMQQMDILLEDISSDNSRDKQLRDSVSTVMSSERSFASSLGDSPSSSPASSVMGTSRKGSFPGSRTPTPLHHIKQRRGSSSRLSMSAIPRRIPLTRSGDFTCSPSFSPLTTRSTNVKTLERGEVLVAGDRPRWNGSTKTATRDFLPLSALEPSRYAKSPLAKQTNYLRSTSTPTQTPSNRPPARKPMRNVSTPSRSAQSLQPTPSTVSVSVSVYQQTPQKSSLPVPVGTSPPVRAITAFAGKRPASGLRTSLQSAATSGRSSRTFPILPATDGNEADTERPTHHKSRPSSSLASDRRSSMLPIRANRRSYDMAATANVLIAPEDKPKWRP